MHSDDRECEDEDCEDDGEKRTTAEITSRVRKRLMRASAAAAKRSRAAEESCSWTRDDGATLSTTATTTTTTVHDLPRNALEAVPSHLAVVDLAHVSRSCRFLRHFIRNSQHVWQCLCRRYYGEMVGADLVMDIVFGESVRWTATFKRRFLRERKAAEQRLREAEAAKRDEDNAAICPKCNGKSLVTETFERNVECYIFAVCRNCGYKQFEGSSVLRFHRSI